MKHIYLFLVASLFAFTSAHAADFQFQKNHCAAGEYRPRDTPVIADRAIRYRVISDFADSPSRVWDLSDLITWRYI